MTCPVALAVAPTPPVAAGAIGGVPLPSRAARRRFEAAFGVAATTAVAYSFELFPWKGERALSASPFRSLS
jgi:hypothetical protein